MTKSLPVCVGLLCLTTSMRAQPSSNWPTPPSPLGETREIALATSAAPAEIAERADVYVLRDKKYVRAKTGTNGCSCLVGRDYHEGSLYPICFDQVTSATWLKREIKEGELRAAGVPEEDVQRQVEAAYSSGELSWGSRPGLAYMMSREQVLFSSPAQNGRKVGAWWPHVMLILPGVTAAQLGLAQNSSVTELQIQARGHHHGELVMKLPAWSDGTPVIPTGNR